ncbi:MAG: response regulator [Acidobacteria bacterium]|nr:response regulator [Acidobacteriota bacterium]
MCEESARVQKLVLVVEDSQVIQRLIEVCLRPAGFDVEMRDDGPTGLEAALEMKPDLVILDVGLPGMDGWEVLAEIRSSEDAADLKVMVLTAHAQEEVRQRADEVGADAFLTKPFRPNELREMAISLVGLNILSRG